jgi:hypothetical protein
MVAQWLSIRHHHHRRASFRWILIWKMRRLSIQQIAL